MKKTSILLLIIGLSFILHAEKIDIDIARNVAKNLTYERLAMNKNALIKNEGVLLQKIEEVIYFFNFEPEGWALISAQDNVYPILAYGDDGYFDYDTINPAAKLFIDDYMKQIKWAIDNNQVPNNETKQLWKRLSNEPLSFTPKSIRSVNNLLVKGGNEIEWGQGAGWNNLCPVDNQSTTLNNHVWAGCVATAMGQIMYYWEHPNVGQGQHSYDSDYGLEFADFGNSLYDYSVIDTDIPTSEAQELLYHCGVSVEMNYGPNSSGAYDTDVDNALKDYFRYNPIVDYETKSGYTLTAWENLLRDDLNNARPLYYAATDSDDGRHAFVCSGWQGDHELYFNWGWNGAGNDFYTINNLTPSGYNFELSHAIVRNIEPFYDNIEITLLNNNIPDVISYSGSYYDFDLKNTGNENIVLNFDYPEWCIDIVQISANDFSLSPNEQRTYRLIIDSNQSCQGRGGQLIISNQGGPTLKILNLYQEGCPIIISWQDLPDQVNQTSITMSLTNTPDYGYYYDYIGSPTGGGGGTDSGWQSSISYTDNGLEPNHKYGYRGKAKNTIGEESEWTSTEYAYTDIEQVSGITFSDIGIDHIKSKSSNTPSGLTRDLSGLRIFDADSPSYNHSGWKQNNDYWTYSGLDANTQYGIRGKSRNGDGDETSICSIHYIFTLANTPVAPFVHNATSTTVELDIEDDGNPSYTEYAIFNSTLGQWISSNGSHTSNKVWRTDSDWEDITITGLQPNTTYTFKVLARNGDNVETDFGPGTDKTTALPPNGSPVLDNYYVQPDSGNSQTQFMFHVEYSDPEGEVPTTHKVYINGQNYQMSYISGPYTNDAVYEYTSTYPVGDYSYYFYFSDGRTNVSSNTGQFEVVDPDFTFDVDPISQTISINSDPEFTISTTSIAGYQETVNLSVSNLPTHLDYNFSSSPITLGESSILTINPTAQTLIDTYSFEIVGTSGRQIVHSAQVEITFIEGTPVSGNQNGLWELSNSPYLVTGDIEITSGDVLEIEAGVEVNFQGHYKFDVYGTLLAYGTDTDGILFTTDDHETGWGGIKFWEDSDESVLTYCTVEYGKQLGSSKGGGVYTYYSDFELVNCIISNNSTNTGSGGGIYLEYSLPLLINCLIDSNYTLDGYAPGVCLYYCSAQLTGCTIQNNSTYSECSVGGGFYISHEGAYPSKINSCIISNNFCDSDGGGLFLRDANTIFENCVIANNYIIDDDANDMGGGVYKGDSGSPQFNNCIIWGNNAHGNGDQIYVDDLAPLEISYSDIQDYTSSSHVYGPVNYGSGMLNTDPQFISDYQLNVSSLCVDAGDPDIVDALLPPGLNTNITDMGAYGGNHNYTSEVPGLLINPESLDFNQVKIGNSRSFIITLCNLSTNVIDLQSVSSTNLELLFTYTSGPVATSDSVIVEVEYLPLTLGSWFDIIDITINGLSLNFSVSGEGVNEVVYYGDVSGTWYTEDSPIYIVDDITIPQGQTLTIEEGVQVEFQAECKFDVYGDLMVQGTEGNTVRFYAGGGNSYWAGIRIYNSDGCSFDHAILEDSRKIGGTTIEQSGGALYIDNSTTSISNTTFQDNYTNFFGGALYLTNNATVELYSCVFQNNSVNNNTNTDYIGGGAITVVNQSTINLEDCLLQSNESTSYESDNCGGALLAANSMITLYNCDIINNTVSSNDDIDGGGIALEENCVLRIDLSNISYNTATSPLGDVRGGGLRIGNGCNTIITSSQISYNTLYTGSTSAEQVLGGGICDSGDLTIYNCDISNNSLSALGNNCEGYGGGINSNNNIYVYHSTVINNSINAENSADGGGIMGNGTYIGNIISNNSCTGEFCYGGGIRGNGTYTNNVIIGNTLSSSNIGRGGGVYFASGTMYNCILYGNSGSSGSQIYGRSSEPGPVVDYCDVQDYQSSGSYNFIQYGSNILDTDPLFRDVGSDDYHLQLSSSCIDFGHPDMPDACLSDSTGLGTTVNDLGAYGGLYNCGQYESAILSTTEEDVIFGDVFVDSDSTHVMTIFNYGNIDLDITSFDITGSDSLQFSVDLILPTTISSGEESSFSIIYSPTTNTLAIAQLNIYSNNILGVKTIDLTGQGVTPDIAVNPETILFGNVLVGTTDTLFATVYNHGNGNLFIQEITISDPVFSLGEYDFTIVPGDSTIMPVFFTPISTGDFPSQIEIVSNDTLLIIPISGTGIAPAISVTQGNLDFGYVHISEDSTLVLNIQNTGTADLHITDVISSNSAFVPSTTILTILPSQTDNVLITFSPTIHQNYNGVLTVFSDADTVYINLSGDGYEYAFNNISSQAGINLTDNSRSSSWADYDGDGFEDLFIANYYTESRLFRNNGDGTFTDRSMLAGIFVNGPAYSGVWADFDNDDDIDLYVTLYGQSNILYQNEGDGTFSDISYSSGTNDVSPSKGASWADFDNDGFIDLFVCNYGSPNRLYQNQGNGTFIDISTSFGLDYSGQSQIGVWIDYDSDGDQDLYVVNWNNEANLFYRNESGISFTEIGASVGIAGLEKSKSACWGDFDNDGDQDLYVVNWLDQPNKFYRNDTQSCFTEIGSIAGIADEGYGNGASWCDYDNDGYLDLLLVTWIEDSNLLFRNSGDGTFEDFSHIAGIDDIPIARSISICDYNNDGFIDCYVSVDAGENIFYQNTLSNNNWLKLTLEGNLSNRSAIGTNVTIQSGRLIRSFSINSGEGYMSGNSLTLDMGLGSLEMLDQIDVNWPSGMQNTLYNVSCCQHLIITEDVILSTPESISIQIENDQITISWDEVTGANSYIVYRSSNVDGIFTQISGSLNEFTIDGYRVSWSGAIQDTKGFYYVKASTDNWYMNVGKKDNQRQK